MEEKQINASESFEIITKMIANTQERWEGNAGRPSLIWGYSTVFVSLLIWSLRKLCGITDTWPTFLWFLIPVIGGLLLLAFRDEVEKGYTTIIDKVIKYVWITLGVACGVVSVASFFLPMPILFFVILLVSVGIIITGLVLRIKVYTICGLIGGLLSFVCLLFEEIDTCLIFAALFVFVCIIPGHVLNHHLSNKSHR